MRMSVRDIVEIVVVVAGGLLGWFALQEREDRVRVEAQMGLLQEQVEEAQALASEAIDNLEVAQEGARIAVDSLRVMESRARALTDSLDVIARSKASVHISEADGLREILGEIRVILPDEAKLLVDSAFVRVDQMAEANASLADAFDQQQQAFAEFMMESSITINAVEARAEAAEEAAAQWENVAMRERRAKEAAETLATPGVLGRVKLSLPFFSVEGTVAAAIGFVTGVVVTR